MRIDLDRCGGVLLQGTWDEIDDLTDTLRIALDDDTVGRFPLGSMLTDDGVVQMTLQIEESR